MRAANMAPSVENVHSGGNYQAENIGAILPNKRNED